MFKKFKVLDRPGSDLKNTRALIYPQNPYGKSDYKIEIEMSCENQEESK